MPTKTKLRSKVLMFFSILPLFLISVISALTIMELTRITKKEIKLETQFPTFTVVEGTIGNRTTHKLVPYNHLIFNDDEQTHLIITNDVAKFNKNGTNPKKDLFMTVSAKIESNLSNEDIFKIDFVVDGKVYDATKLPKFDFSVANPEIVVHTRIQSTDIPKSASSPSAYLISTYQLVDKDGNTPKAGTLTITNPIKLSN